ncbi:superoxide dismutase [Streptomyces sp. Li-HN-5-11]|uniref:SMP-30/gluconolactonase/LRE family protein n=1 Tax=Streptomyces sp. Li-HN-5-11 TaxID=3075432 RepID=UPI0028AC5E75|nr:superoxide dismutase [Streptomyces sp. Li-HN-5-11]WNM32577.1 superoxide dismutase [Streptomyces sp. Li-HN-5-11]WOP38674.1 superoxide dismutase [Streptomyces sp. Li-HN-5-13]
MSSVRLRGLRAAAVATAALLVLGGAAPAALATSGGGRSHHPALAKKPPLPSSYTIPGDKAYPEGIARQHGTPYFYVGSTTDGTIYRGDVHQSDTRVFLPGGEDGRTSVAGMKTDRAGRLIVAGGATGKVFVYDTRTRALLHVFDTGRTDVFLNDVALAPNGDAYISDSLHPALWHITAAELHSGTVHQPLRVGVDLSRSPMVYDAGFNGNGLAVTGDGRYVLLADYNDYAFYRIDVRTHQVVPIDLGGAKGISGDGLLLRGNTLTAVTELDHPEGQISILKLSHDYTRARLVRTVHGHGMHSPSTAAFDGPDLLIVNFQFQITDPHLPFDVVRVHVE